MARLPTIQDHMDHEVPVVAPEMPILKAVAFLLDERVTGAPVVDANNRVVGILTEYDCLRLVATGKSADVPEGTVADYMTSEVVTAPPSMDIYYAAGLFLKHTFRRLPVVKDGVLVGAITRFDLLRVIRERL